MTDTAVELETVEPVEKALSGPPAPVSDEQLVAMPVERARPEGLQLTGQGGLLQQLTKRVLESALEGEIADHLGYEKHDAAGRGSGNSRNKAAALKCIYMALMSLDPTGKGRRRWTMRWKAPLNAFQIAFEGRLTPSNN